MISLRNRLAGIREVLPEGQRREKETHAGLWFDKYIVEQIRDNTDSRRDLIAEVSSLPTPIAYQMFYGRWLKILDECSAKTRQARVQGRMVVGLGSESVLETSICLHRTYGVPYIPGSALKGLAANYARSKRVGNDWAKDGIAYKTVFGDTDDAGYITFFDALYIPDTGYKGQVLYPDIITVHHQKYYQDTGAAPTDSDNPIPVPFLSATGTYLIALAAPDIQQADAWIKATFDILEEALKTLGIGAKTSSGYGRMKYLLDNPQHAAPNLQVEDKYVRPSTLPTFQPGKDVPGVVMKPNDIEEIRQKVSLDDACAVLQFQAYPFKDVLIIIPSEYIEAANWAPGNTRICHFVREEARGRCTVLVCKPRPQKNKEKKR
jgi:CRISPR-associated protein Cmr6